MTTAQPLVPHPGPRNERGTPSAQDRAGKPIRATTLELFFDLIFAFTLTQPAVVLTERSLGPPSPPRRVVRVLLIFGLLWWMYGGYAWLTNTPSPERLMLILGMTGFLVAGLAPPGAAGPGGRPAGPACGGRMSQ